MISLIPLVVLIPLGSAALALALPGRRRAQQLITVVALVCVVALSGAFMWIVDQQGALVMQVGGWAAPFGISLVVDRLSALMLTVSAVVLLGVLLFSLGQGLADGDDETPVSIYYPTYLVLGAGVCNAFIAGDLFNLYVTLELVGLAAVGLVAAGGGTQQVAAALRYLFATLLGSGAYLLGVALLYGAYGTVSSATLLPLVTAEAPRLVRIAAGLMVTGLLLKTALFPFHFWLPPAHGGAPAPVSALLSALVVKASFYLILRLWLGPLQALLPSFAWLLALLGAAAIFWGSWQAIRAVKVKRLIAYSTVAQLGYLFLIFPLLPAPGALQAGVMQVFAHGLAKAGMFAAAGVMIKATGQDTVAGLAGAVERLPVTFFAFGLAGMTLMGLPPSSGFLAKWQIIDAALAQGHWVIAVVALAGGLLAAVYVFRVLRQAFLQAPAPDTATAVPRTLEWTAFALAAASVLLGLRGVELMQLVTM